MHLQEVRLDQVLNAKEFAVLAGISYSMAREWFRFPGFPVFRGVAFWGDFRPPDISFNFLAKSGFLLAGMCQMLLRFTCARRATPRHAGNPARNRSTYATRNGAMSGGLDFVEWRRGQIGLNQRTPDQPSQSGAVQLAFKTLSLPPKAARILAEACGG